MGESLLEKNTRDLKEKGLYHPELMPTGIETVKLPAPVPMPEEATVAAGKKINDQPVDMEPLYEKLWKRLLEHDSDHPITKTQLVIFLFPVSSQGDPNKDDDNAGGRNSIYRKIRDMIEELREVYGKLAGSRGSFKSIRGGYFACHTEKDYQIARTYRLQKMLAEKAAVDGLDRNWAAAQGKAWQKPEQEVLV